MSKDIERAKLMLTMTRGENGRRSGQQNSPCECEGAPSPVKGEHGRVTTNTPAQIRRQMSQTRSHLTHVLAGHTDQHWLE